MPRRSFARATELEGSLDGRRRDVTQAEARKESEDASLEKVRRRARVGVGWGGVWCGVWGGVRGAQVWHACLPFGPLLATQPRRKGALFAQGALEEGGGLTRFCFGGTRAQDGNVCAFSLSLSGVGAETAADVWRVDLGGYISSLPCRHMCFSCLRPTLSLFLSTLAAADSLMVR